MKKTIDAFDYAGQICRAIKKGILLTTAADGNVNTMTIGWGSIGIQWGRPVFIAYIRESRFTKELLDNNGEFTVNIPIGEVNARALGYCGTKSGRDCDKFVDLGLTPVDGNRVSVPGIKEFPLTLECKVIYKQEEALKDLPGDILDRFYSEGDPHTAYYGQILDAYVIEE